MSQKGMKLAEQNARMEKVIAALYIGQGWDLISFC